MYFCKVLNLVFFQTIYHFEVDLQNTHPIDHVTDVCHRRKCFQISSSHSVHVKCFWSEWTNWWAFSLPLTGMKRDEGKLQWLNLNILSLMWRRICFLRVSGRIVINSHLVQRYKQKALPLTGMNEFWIVGFQSTYSSGLTTGLC